MEFVHLPFRASETEKLCETLRDNLMVMGGAIAAFRARNLSLYMLIASHITRGT
ncbi:hypothetical protein [Nostoc commune]|uniref:hypothetical protein n=1 Tax=Nostoc commune TaxID=1178 RepID=UPI0020744CB9|nr:hypothetical protein [Nostoc commune]